MTSHIALDVMITTEQFLADPHAAKYRDIVESNPEGFARVMAILNDPYQQEQLLAAERFGRPALAGIAMAIEGDEKIAASLVSSRSPRFRQTVGVAVRLTMEALGWVKTGRKGPVRGATFFRRAERYVPRDQAVPSMEPDNRARAALNAVERIGDEEERRRTGDELLRSLAQTRRAENRPF